MKNMKYARTLLTLALVLVVLGSIVGGTIAWFTDEVESAGNVIKSGTLDMTVAYADAADGTFADLENASAPLFDYEYWEPGYTQVKYLKIANAGDLAFKFQLNVKPSVDVDVNAAADLAEVIDVYYAVVDDSFVAPASRTDLASLTNAGTIKDLMNADAATAAVNGILLPEAGAADVQIPAGDTPMTGEAVYCIALHMQEEAGNEYQNLTVGDGFSLEVLATQYTYENDSFDNTYDEDAEWPNSDLPDADVETIKTADLPQAVDIYTIMPSFGTTSEHVALDVGYVFTALDTPEEAAQSPYADWHADYVVKLDKPAATGTLGLAGQYDSWSSDWLGFHSPIDLEAGQEIRLLNDTTGIKFNYVELCESVKVFSCGAYNLDDANKGTTLTVELRLYEPNPDDVGMNNTNDEGETGKYVVVSSHKYTFGAVQEANLNTLD